MDTIRLDFEQAKAKHLLFKSKLRSILYGLEVDEAPVVSHYECAVGKWIYEHALKAYGSLPEMHELESVHASLHKKAAELVEKYKSGAVEAARFGLEDIEKIADQLVGLLDILEKKTHQIGAQPAEYQSLDQTVKELIDLSKENQKLEDLIKKETVDLLKDKLLLTEAFMQIPASISILKGPNHVVQFANPEVKNTLGGMDIVGKAVADVFPELEAQGYIQLLNSVYSTGEPYVGTEKKVVVKINGEDKEFYSNVSYSAIRSYDGNIEGILAFSYNVTELVLARKKAEDYALRLKEAYEDLDVKVKFRNIELEEENRNLKDKLSRDSEN